MCANAQLCMDDYISSDSFYANFKKNVSLSVSDDKQIRLKIHLYGLSSHGKVLGVVLSNFSIFWSTRRSPTRENYGAVTALNIVPRGIEVLWLGNNSI